MLVATLLLVAVGLIHFMTYSPLVVMGQMFLPNHVGLASGVTFGLAVTIGGVAAPFLGMVADQHGIRAALWCVAFLPVLATGFALTLPHPEKRHWLPVEEGLMRILVLGGAGLQGKAVLYDLSRSRQVKEVVCAE